MGGLRAATEGGPTNQALRRCRPPWRPAWGQRFHRAASADSRLHRSVACATTINKRSDFLGCGSPGREVRTPSPQRGRPTRPQNHQNHPPRVQFCSAPAGTTPGIHAVQHFSDVSFARATPDTAVTTTKTTSWHLSHDHSSGQVKWFWRGVPPFRPEAITRTRMIRISGTTRRERPWRAGTARKRETWPAPLRSRLVRQFFPGMRKNPSGPERSGSRTTRTDRCRCAGDLPAQSARWLWLGRAGQFAAGLSPPGRRNFAGSFGGSTGAATGLAFSALSAMSVR